MTKKEDIEYTLMIMKGIIDAIQELIDEEIGEGFVITILLHPADNLG